MTPELLSLLRSVDTPTVCNAIEMVQGGRGFDAFTRGTPVAFGADAMPIVGHAVTAQIAAQAPPDDPPEVVRARRMDYYRAMHDAPRPGVAVVEDLDFPDCVGAFWGEVNATVHRGFGLAGTLTNGVMRDLDDIPRDYPILAGSLGPSHAFVHVRAIGVPITVFGLSVCPEDLIHADRHGAVVIPPDVLPALADAIARLSEVEALVLTPARAPDFDFTAFVAAWEAFEKART